MPEYKATVRQPFTDESMKIVYVEYEMPGPNRHPLSAAPDKNGIVWMPFFGRANKIGRLDPATGAIQEFTVPNQDTAGIHSAVPAPDGTVWIGEQAGNRFGKWDPKTQTITEYKDTYQPGMEGLEDGGSKHTVRVDPESVSKRARVDLLRDLDARVRRAGDAIRQVGASISEKKRAVLVANSEGLWIEDSRQYSRIRLSAIAEKGAGPQIGVESPGVLGGYEFFQELDLDKLAQGAAQSAILMAGAGYIDGGMMPVVLGNGFGGVIFHEACGHPLETEAIRKNASPFAGKVGQAVAQPILTAIDDGTLDRHWGSLNVDDEGTPAQRTVLIEQGILKNYLSDRIGARQAGVPRSGSARRESYRYAPVSRMRNTYIDRGPHSVDEMIASVDFGLYAKKMGGGSVDPATGEFNFAVQEGYAIRKGKIAEPVRGATLIGKGHEVLPLISMIGSDLELAAGMCGASSGWVPTTVGQPTLKIDRILVGGR